MKFLFVANFIGDEDAGTSGHIIRLAGAIEKRGHVIHTLFRDDLFSGIKKNVFLQTIIFLLFPFIAVFKIFYLDLRNRYDFVSVSSGDGFLYAFFAKTLLRKRKPIIIMHSHGYEYLYKKEFDAEGCFDKRSRFTFRERIFLFKFRLMQVKIFSYLCDSIFTLNESERAYLERIYPKKKIFAVPNGIGPIFMSREEAPRNRDILFVGGWTRLKGRVYLTDIIDRLVKDKRDIAVSIIGAGVDQARVLNDFQEMVRKNILVVRFMPRAMLKREYLAHKVFLFPSLFEGFGNVVLEAMASGMAVIISKGLGASEVISDGYNGFLVEKRDVDGFVKKANELLRNERLREEIGENARKSVSRMSWNNSAETFIKNCERLKLIKR